jgi:hypothetical protein
VRGARGGALVSNVHGADGYAHRNRPFTAVRVMAAPNRRPGEGGPVKTGKKLDLERARLDHADVEAVMSRTTAPRRPHRRSPGPWRHPQALLEVLTPCARSGTVFVDSPMSS